MPRDITMNNAWECRDQADQAEAEYNHPLRVKNRRLEDENLMLKRLLREKGLTWPSPYNLVQTNPSFSRVTRSKNYAYKPSSVPYLPVEIMLKILQYALTSPHPIVNPLLKTRPDHLTSTERSRSNQIAIHFLATCKAYHTEGAKLLWTKNIFVFTSVQAVKAFADVKPSLRQTVTQVNFRIIARYYDDEDRVHRLPKDHHPKIQGRVKLKVTKRPREPTLARHGFRAYAWYQLVDFLEALLPPHDPSHDPSLTRQRLFPNLEKLRIDLINFGEDMFQYPPTQLHDLASHQLGCSLNELIVTGLPRDDAGYRTSNELSGLLKDDGLLINHAPTLVAMRSGLRHLAGDHFHPKVIRSMRRDNAHDHHNDSLDLDDFPPAPPEEGEPPFSQFMSCRTIWKRVPEQIDKPERKWVLFDRVSGLPWDDIIEEATMFDFLEDSDDEEGMMCENCGEIHPGAILPDELMEELYDDL